MAWPVDVADGQVLLAAHVNAIKNSVATWGGSVDAAGFNLVNIGRLGIGSTNPNGPLEVKTSADVRWGVFDDTIGNVLTQALNNAASGYKPWRFVAASFSFETGLVAIKSMPAANPGAGTKVLWYDPADGNRVKFAV